MATLRQLLSKTLMPDEPDDGLKGMEFEYLGSYGGPKHYRITFRHKNRRKKDFVLEDVMLGQSNSPSPEEVFGILHRELRDWFAAQQWYPNARNKVEAFILYANDNFGGSNRENREAARLLNEQGKNLKRFFGEDWIDFAQIDFRSHAFHWKPKEDMALPIRTWALRDPDAEEWFHVRCYISYRFLPQVPYIAVTGYSAMRDDPEGGGGATWFPDEDWSQEQREQMVTMDSWHLTNIMGVPMHMMANGLYHYKNEDFEASKRTFLWGRLVGEVFEDTDAFKSMVGKMKENDEKGEERVIALAQILWDDILRIAEPQFRPTLELLFDYMKSRNLNDFFSEKKHLTKEGDDGLSD